MKVYFVVKEPSERTINHFVSSLGNALQKQGCEVVYGLEMLWTDGIFDCDIVHFQWPEYVFGAQKQKFSDNDITRMSHRLIQLKGKGIKIFVQVHNLRPHTNKDKNVLRIYDDVYSFDIPQKEARRRLHLPSERKIVLSFGRFRNDEERHFILNLKNTPPYLGETGGGALFLMPGFYRETLHTLNPKKLIPRLFHTINYRLRGINFCNEVIPDDLMQCHFCAADAVLIQRLDILNSGNLPMAFHAGKVVVGPDVGNVGQILRKTGNFTFDPHDIRSAVSALQKALTETTKGKDNKTYAIEHWASDLIATTLLKIYKHEN